MPNRIALQFASALQQIEAELAALPETLADVPWRSGGWTRKQIVGHMVDSAANNHQRFVRAAIDGSYAGPDYAQQEWVNAHGYEAQSWPTLLRWWQCQHQILAAVVERIPDERLNANCTVGSGTAVTLDFLITDYLRHQRWHLDQLKAAPGA